MFEKLTDVFAAAAIKYLSRVDANPKSSNQHEIGGLVEAGIGERLGRPSDGSKLRFAATMVYIDDYSDDPIIAEDRVSWYDTRYDDPDRSAEWRLYYPGNPVTEAFRESDFMLIALTHDRELLMIFCPQGSESEVQLKTLFGATVGGTTSRLKKVPIEQSVISVPIRLMLARYGIELEVNRPGDDDLRERVINQFGSYFPRTAYSGERDRSFRGS
jgi:hypothetical protein